MRKISLLFICLFILSFISLQTVSSLSVSVHVPEKYTNVDAGERIYFEIEVKYPENPKRKDLRLEYEIFNLDGDLVAQSKALKAVETQASFIDFIVLPENTETGIHLINVRVRDYETLSEEVSSSFHVKGAGIDQVLIYFIILLIAVLLIGVLVIIGMRGLKKKA